MRTLKKSLALVLALVMVLGLGVVGVSADNAIDNFTDASDIGDAYYEAVGVLTGLGIIDGMTDTTIAPTATYTREQAAKIIAYMVLGKTNADSLTCTKDPFDDVAADRWSAGYISFCQEQGIIDGMTESTFEPTGTLTGFQWAKMLLSAVGFNHNGEFEGASWSLNTARVAHEAGLFNGDTSGADHIAISRQQAALYAFNTLTGIKQVTYTSNGNNYVYGIYGYDFADGTGYTLGDKVFGLNYAYGVITDNEGMGAKVTTLTQATVGQSSRTTIDIAADTGLDMMYHAAKIWFTGASTFTGVFTMDLAKTESATCTGTTKAMNDASAKYASDLNWKEIGSGVLYRFDVIDNTAYVGSAVANATNTDYDYVTVQFDVTIGTLGRTDSVSGNTYLNGTTVKTNTIKTDISNIDQGSKVIVLTANNTGHTAYYIYAVTSTTGNVKDYNTTTGAITLTDGTVLQQSSLIASNQSNYQDVLKDLVTKLVGTSYATPAYVFELDTHGHYMSLNNNSLKSVAYYTGTYKHTEAWGSWHGEELYSAQFVELSTGNSFEVPVTASWKNTNGDKAGYYDTTSSLYGNTTYYPERVQSSSNPYGGKYIVIAQYGSGALKFDVDASTTSIVPTSGTIENAASIGTIRFNPATVNFVVSTGKGSTLSFVQATGVADLLSKYSANYNGIPFDMVTLTNAIAIVEKDVNGGYYATTIFAFGNVSALGGGYVYFTKPASDSDVVATDNYYWQTIAYMNGATTTETIKVTSTQDLTSVVDAAGLYRYSIDSNGIWTLSKAQTQVTLTDKSDFHALDANTWELTINTTKYTFTNDVTVIDVTNPKTNEPITSLAALINRLQNEQFTCYFIPGANNVVSTMYVQLDSSN